MSAPRPGGWPAPVLLVGAGPGDPDLLTLAAHRALAQADLVVADRLVPAAILALAGGEVRIARKHPGRAEEAQAELHAWMLEGARAGRRVVRLKIGDPGLYGRLEEELAFLAAHGIEARVVPGVSSVSALGVPLTARGAADRVVVCTGHGAGDRDVALPAFDPGTTVVFLMAVSRLGELVAGLLAAGFPADWPARVVQDASRPTERSVVAPLAVLPVAAGGFGAPAVVVVGRVAALVTAPAALPR